MKINITKISMRIWILGGFILAAGFLLLSYSSVLSQYFWDEDDFAYVSPAIEANSPTYIFDSKWYVQEFPRPVTHLYCWLIALFSGTVIWPYFLSNLLLYAASSVLLFRLVHRVSGDLRTGIIAGVFYLICPCATDNLYWMAAGATGFLSGFFILLTANMYIQGRNDTDRGFQIIALFTAVLAMGTKESALSLPILLTLLEFNIRDSKKGWIRRLLPFYIIGFLFALNVLLIQFSSPGDGNISKYGLSWMIPRNLLHFFIYPMAGVMPPRTGEYTLIKLIIYPVLWVLPLFIGSGRVKKLVLLGFGWIGLSSLPFIPWIMDFEGLLPKICDIPSRYFNTPSMGASMVVGGFLLMLHEKFGKVISYCAAVLFLVFVAITGVQWTSERVQNFVQQGATEACLVDITLSSWNGSGILYIGAFGLYEFRIDCYNRMYFHGQLLQADPFPLNVPAGTRMLCGPINTPKLFVFDGSLWSVERCFESCDRSMETIGDR